MDELVRWLGKQLDEDAEAAREAVEQVGDGHWQQRNARIVTVADRDREVADYAVHECIDHIVRHDPARVLREIDAKRGVVARYEFACKEAAALGISEEERETRVQVGGALQACVVVLATVYADRPGYAEAIASAE